MVGEGRRRRTRESGERRSERVGVAFTPTELALVQAAAGRVGMSAAGWVGQQTMAVAQHVLVPVSAHRADVLRDLVQARAGLREIAVRLDALDVLTINADTATVTDAGTNAASIGTAAVTVQDVLATDPAPAPATGVGTKATSNGTGSVTVQVVLATDADTVAGTNGASSGAAMVTVQDVLADIRAAVLRVDAATVAVMRERQPRS